MVCHALRLSMQIASSEAPLLPNATNNLPHLQVLSLVCALCAILCAPPGRTKFGYIRAGYVLAMTVFVRVSKSLARK